MPRVSLADIMELSISERIPLVEDIWDSIATVSDAVQLADDQRKELERRLEEYHKNPEGGSPWEQGNRIKIFTSP